jgi:hypothetical protein
MYYSNESSTFIDTEKSITLRTEVTNPRHIFGYLAQDNITIYTIEHYIPVEFLSLNDAEFMRTYLADSR